MVDDKTPVGKIPRTIYFLWWQGIDQAPLVVRRCLESWQKQNPGWKLVVLDQNNVADYVRLDVPYKKLANLDKCHLADLIRVYLLAAYGGVWTDATVYCNRPLDEWLHECMNSGFFCFYRPAQDRLISNWFLAAARENYVVVKMKSELTGYWSLNNFEMGPRLKSLIGKLAPRAASYLLNRNEKTTGFWFSPLFTRYLRVYPYFAFHYLFAKLVAEDPEFREIWTKSKKISASGPHRLQEHGLFAERDAVIEEDIIQRQCPLYKLTWKYDSALYREGCVLHYLLECRDHAR